MAHYFQDTTNSSQGHTAGYTYDNMMRLATSVATGSATHNLTFSYDRYGNMTCVTNQQTQGPCPSYGFSASTNQITNSNYIYDAAGNLTQDGTGTGTHTYQWDAENRMISIDTGTTSSYTYNALGQRVEKKVGSAYTEFMFDESGEPVGENNRTSWSVSVVPFGGRHLAHYQSSATYFLHGNNLGSTSQATDYSGAMSQDQLYYPWGGDWSMVGTSQEKRFASLQHRDTAETGLDPTHFRMFSSTQGRWLSTDPVRGWPHNPQKLNRYSYVGNAPATRTDPLGNQYCDPYYDPFCFGEPPPVSGQIRFSVSCPSNKSCCCPYYQGLAADGPTIIDKDYGAGAYITCMYLTGTSCEDNCDRWCLVEKDIQDCSQRATLSDRMQCRIQAHITCFGLCSATAQIFKSIEQYCDRDTLSNLYYSKCGGALHLRRLLDGRSEVASVASAAIDSEGFVARAEVSGCNPWD